MIGTVIIIDNGFLGMAALGALIVFFGTKYRGWHRELWFWPMLERWRDRRHGR